MHARLILIRPKKFVHFIFGTHIFWFQRNNLNANSNFIQSALHLIRARWEMTRIVARYKFTDFYHCECSQNEKKSFSTGNKTPNDWLGIGLFWNEWMQSSWCGWLVSTERKEKTMTRWTRCEIHICLLHCVLCESNSVATVKTGWRKSLLHKMAINRVVTFQIVVHSSGCCCCCMWT